MWFLKWKPTPSLIFSDSTLIGVIIGSGLSFLAVFFQNDHSREMQKSQREYDLKKELYFPLIESANKSLEFFSRIPELSNQSVQAQEPLLELSKNISKMYLVASPDILDALNKAYVIFYKNFLGLMEERIPISEINLEVENKNKFIEMHSNRMKILLDRQDSLIDRNDTTTTNLVTFLTERVSQEAIAINNLSEEINQLITKKNVLVFKIVI